MKRCFLFLIRVDVLVCLSFAFTNARASAQADFKDAPIHYSSSVPTDQVNELASATKSGDVSLTWNDRHGWLPSILRQLDVPSSSQTLVFSKTSMQFRRISPSRPRAIYFNDEIYVGWVNGGDVLEIGAVDPKLGAVFYSVEQKRGERPEFKRDRGECMACHASGRTQKVPGFLVRSVHPLPSGQPEYRFGTSTVDHTTPLEERFGGWYVTGSHGEMRHRGNTFVTGDNETEPINCDLGANAAKLPRRVQTDDYLEPTSDIVALMLLEHQSQMHNFVTKAGYTCRVAMAQQEQMNAILERDRDYRSESTIRRIHRAAEELVEYLFFSREFRLTSPVAGNSKFAAEFSAKGKRDQSGRSLRDLDLRNRLLRYPCSYLVYSKSFLALPQPVLDRVKHRMLEVLDGADKSEAFSHLSVGDRRCILDILRDTHPLFGMENSE